MEKVHEDSCAKLLEQPAERDQIMDRLSEAVARLMITLRAARLMKPEMEKEEPEPHIEAAREDATFACTVDSLASIVIAPVSTHASASTFTATSSGTFVPISAPDAATVHPVPIPFLKHLSSSLCSDSPFPVATLSQFEAPFSSSQSKLLYPWVLLLDESMNALDPISKQDIEEAIVRLKKMRGLMMMMVSHSVKQMQRIADLVCLVIAGEFVEVLALSELSDAKHPMTRRFLELS